MKRTITAVLLFALVTAITPLAAFAQDGEMTYAEASTEDGLITTMIPEEWGYEELPAESFLRGIAFANTETALEKVVSEDDIPLVSGDVGAIAAVLPADLLLMIGVELTEDLPVTDLALALATAFSEPDDPEVDPMPDMGEPEEVALGDDLVAGRVYVVEEDKEGVFIVYPTSEDTVAVVYVATFPGEYTDAMEQIALTAAENLVFTGTAPDLVPQATSDETDMGGGDMDGEALVAARCTTCHSAQRIDDADKDEAGWTATVDRMIGYGAPLDDDERQAVIDYLAETH